MVQIREWEREHGIPHRIWSPYLGVEHCKTQPVYLTLPDGFDAAIRPVPLGGLQPMPDSTRHDTPSTTR